MAQVKQMKSWKSLLIAGSGLLTLLACNPAEQSPDQSNQQVLSQAGLDTAELDQKESSAELGEWGVDLTIRDLSIKPGDDFFRYATGSWLETFEIPADKSRYGAFDSLWDRSDQRIRGIIEDLVDQEPAQDSMDRKIADYYLSYMNIQVLDEQGIDPLRPALKRISDIESREDLIVAFGRSPVKGTSYPIGFRVGTDRVNPDRHQLNVTVTGTSLPDRDYYLENTERLVGIRKDFVEHVARMFEFAGFENASMKAHTVLEIETQIATHMWPRAQRRNRDLTYNPMSYDEFRQAYPGYDWDLFFSTAGIENLEDLNVVYPSAMSPIIELINRTSINSWKNYLAYHLISTNSGVLSQEIDDESFAFYSTTLRGVPQQRERWERGVSRVGSLNSLGEALGQVYVEKYFPESAKQQTRELVENLRSALGRSIAENDWMDEATRAEANLKLNSFRPKIAYPDVWRDLSGIQITRGNLFANAQNVRDYFYQDNISRLGKATDRERWGMTPQTVNAYYNSSFNEVVFPAGILQPPFFDPAADLAVNYGGIGGVIGHEMGHGFDDQGSKSDYLGIQRNWWTDSVREAFDAKTSALATQYDGYEPVEGQNIDGNFTLGENIGDVGGLSMAYRAYQMALN
ncbi:MAG: M13 family metallopeptidase, partial [Gammaproteobacteria bacterium]|nr:M13 family metallopeptidase [Gammaproteobacteria bacterium]